MKKISIFFRSLVPLLFVLILQLIVTVPLMIIFAAREMKAAGGSGLAGYLSSVSENQTFSQTANLVYAVAAVLLFGIWYYHAIAKPSKRKRKRFITGFSFHTVVSLIFLAIGLQYLCTLLVDGIALLHPGWIDSYNSLMERAGYSDLSVLLVLYSLILAPIVEELVFRGLTLSYARKAMPFWLANLWQALLFGLLHMNLVQGIYAFAIGLFFGWICRRGHGVKYSILAHMIFNFFGIFFSEFFSTTTGFSYPLFMGLGIALTLFAMWLFYTDMNN